MAKKAPRRTAERILETTLELFNRFGEPNVSTTAISAELRISPGNFYYHYAAKDELVVALYARYEAELSELLGAADGVRDVEDAWFLLHSLFERIWQYRFLYRDLNDLLSRNRHLETHFQGLLARKERAVRAMLSGMERSGALRIGARDLDTVADSTMVVVTYWLSFEYVRDPRHALEPENAQAALLRGAQHVLGLLVPYLGEGQRAHLKALSEGYGTPTVT
ncbi:TetR/AcrR family transcriptional regulator [Paracidovorax anthurii]|uniref:TetR family transcriptional regulator n=1 Tax=Paracidovorax anthurii TaxID=78229 RepID=A0A328Z6N2_9BURK|nr:TetR/AcrR family transcriptional regulator [Paracidovorax anthurii]RAR81404.1 TetR family transcriptional regulator [Paracidovorax anthurii]WCM93983.1 TetR/AcrR family transcriptional regulator [Acidovorax sp. NCPPB 2350]